MRIALGVLPLLAFLAWAVAFYLRDCRGVCHSRTASDPRDVDGQPTLRNAILKAAALLGFWVVLGTESLSVISQLKFVPILLWWLVATIGGISGACHYYNPAFRARLRFSRPRLLTVVAAIPLASILSLALTSALFNPPNNYDSYSYHLPRQVLWLQHANVRHYPANNLRQLEMPPFSEFVGAHLMALSNSDRWTNLIQFAALLVTFCGVSLLTERLGGGRAVQLLACLILLTSPVVFMQASNTKNDIVVAMWIVICACWLFRVLDGAPLRWLDVLLFGAAMGCAGDTKGTGPLFVIPVVIVLCIAICRQFTARQFGMLCATGLVALAINLPHFARNYRAFGRIDGPAPDQGGYPLYNEVHGPRVLLSNVVRLFAWHAAITHQPFNDAMYRGVVWLHDHVLHIGVNDPRTTTPFSAYNGLRFRGADEDRAGSPPLMLLLLLLPFALVMARRRMDIPAALLLCGIALGGFLIFNWLGKWQEWHVRYFIPQTALFAPVLAVAITARWRALVLPLLALSLGCSLIPTIRENPRRLFGSASLFHRDDLTRRFTYIGHNSDFVGLATLIRQRHMKWVGFATYDNFPEYAAMYTIDRRNNHAPNYEFVNPFVEIDGYAPHRAELVIAEPTQTSLVDGATGTRYILYRGGTLFNILLPQADAGR